MRKIINLAFDHYDKDGGITSVTYAICDDGSIWIYDIRCDEWRESGLPSIP